MKAIFTFIRSLPIACCFLFLGCAPREREAGRQVEHSELERVESGNFSPHYLDLLARKGARITNTNEVPRLLGKWIIREDIAGFEVVLYDIPFMDLYKFTTNALNNEGLLSLTSHAEAAIFNAEGVGVAINMGLVEGDDFIQINCLRGLTGGHIQP